MHILALNVSLDFPGTGLSFKRCPFAIRSNALGKEALESPKLATSAERRTQDWSLAGRPLALASRLLVNGRAICGVLRPHKLPAGASSQTYHKPSKGCVYFSDVATDMGLWGAGQPSGHGDFGSVEMNSGPKALSLLSFVLITRGQ